MIAWWLMAALAAAPVSKPAAKAPAGAITDPDFWKDFIPPGGYDGGSLIELPAFRWEVKNVLSSVDVPGAVEADGIPVKLQQVIVKGKVADVLRDFLESFIRQGLYVQPLEQQYKLSAHEQVTGLDPSRFISYSVIAQQVDANTCALILGEANIAMPGSRPRASSDFAPLYPGGSGVARTRGEGLDTLTFEAKAPQAQVKQFYAEVLGKAGYRQVEPDVFQRGREEIRLRTHFANGVTQALLSRRPLPVEGPLGP